MRLNSIRTGYMYLIPNFRQLTYIFQNMTGRQMLHILSNLKKFIHVPVEQDVGFVAIALRKETNNSPR